MPRANAVNANRILIIGILDILQRTLSKKDLRKFGPEVLREALRASIPANGTGPLNAARKEALSVLDEYFRLSAKRGKAFSKPLLPSD